MAENKKQAIDRLRDLAWQDLMKRVEGLEIRENQVSEIPVDEKLLRCVVYGSADDECVDFVSVRSRFGGVLEGSVEVCVDGASVCHIEEFEEFEILFFAVKSIYWKWWALRRESHKVEDDNG